MALEFLGLRTVIHPVTDLAAAKQWWTSLLGFGPYFDEPFYVGFEVAGYELGLLPGANPADGALTYWGVADCQAAMDAAIALGATVHTPASEVGEGIKVGEVREPGGAILGVIENPVFAVKPVAEPGPGPGR
jgi:predicted enzyme related to lactoylglutathione lyase